MGNCLVINIFTVICILSWLDSLQWFFGLYKDSLNCLKLSHHAPLSKNRKLNTTFPIILYSTLPQSPNPTACQILLPPNFSFRCPFLNHYLFSPGLSFKFSCLSNSLNVWFYPFHCLLLPFMSSLPSSVGYWVICYYNNYFTHVNSDWCHFTLNPQNIKMPFRDVQIAWYVSAQSVSSYISETISDNILLSYPHL